MELLKIVDIETRNLKPAEYNPRKISPKQMEDLKRSIKEFWLVEPIIVNNTEWREWIVIWWHQRLEAMKQMGFKKVPVVFVQLSEVKEKALNIALNKITWEFDYLKLQELLADIWKDIEFDTTITWFSQDEIDVALSDINWMIERWDKAKILKDSMIKSWINPNEAEAISEVFEHSKEIAKNNMPNVDIQWTLKQRFLLSFWIEDESDYSFLKSVYWTSRDIENDVIKLLDFTRQYYDIYSQRNE